MKSVQTQCWAILSVLALGVLVLSPFAGAQQDRWEAARAAAEKARQAEDWDEVEAQLKLAIEEAEKFGGRDPRLAASLTDLGRFYRAHGCAGQIPPHVAPYFTVQSCKLAEQYLKRVLEIREAALGRNPLEVAAALDELAELYLVWPATQTPARRSLSGSPVSAPYGPSLATQSSGAALPRTSEVAGTDIRPPSTVPSREDRAPQAWKALQQSLKIREQALGSQNLALLENLSALARVARRLRKTRDEERLLLRIVSLEETHLGPEHAAVAGTLNALGVHYYQRNKYSRAEAAYKRALAIYEKTPGADPAKVKVTQENLALLTQKPKSEADTAQPPPRGNPPPRSRQPQR
jgi:tetratricopeptide (TPR) repeat protein